MKLMTAFSKTSLLAITALSLYSTSPASAEIHICKKLLETVQPVTIRSAWSRQGNQVNQNDSATLLQACGEGCLQYSVLKKPFDTAADITKLSDSRHSYHKGNLVVLSTGQIHGLPFERVERADPHRFLAAGSKVLFAGQVTTTRDGKISTLNYLSPSYSQGPYYLKVLIDDLGGPEALRDVVVSLPDYIKTERYAAYQPAISVPDFYLNCLKPQDKGDDVLLNIIANSSPAETMNYSQYLEPMAVQVLRLISERKTINRFLSNSLAPESDSALMRQMLEWVIMAIQVNPQRQKLIATAILEMTANDQDTNRFRDEFYLRLFRRVPSLKTIIYERRLNWSPMQVHFDVR